MYILPFLSVFLFPSYLFYATFSPLLSNDPTTNDNTESKNAVKKEEQFISPLPYDISPTNAVVTLERESHSPISPLPRSLTPTISPQQKTIQRKNTNDAEKALLSPTPVNIARQPVGSSLEPTPTDTQEAVNPTDRPTNLSGTATAKSTLSVQGKTVHLTISYPKGGGTITSVINGDCTGDGKGTYDGPQTGVLEGSANVICPVGIMKVPVFVAYHGKFFPTDAQATMNYTAAAMGSEQKGTMTLTLHE